MAAAKILVRREVLRQVIAPSRVLMARLMLYYREFGSAQRPWISAKNAISSMASDGSLLTEDIDGTHWYRLPRVGPKKLASALKSKPPVFQKWNRALSPGAGHAEVLWRLAFQSQGWVVPDKPVLVPCPFPDDGEATHAESHEIDVYAAKPGTDHLIACEVRSGPGEGWVSPEVVRISERTKAQKNIRHHFRAMAARGLTPMLAAPYVDPSFYLFQWAYGGIHAKFLYYIFRPADAEIAQQVRETFRIGHLWAEEFPPNNLSSFVSRIPGILDRMQAETDSG